MSLTKSMSFVTAAGDGTSEGAAARTGQPQATATTSRTAHLRTSIFIPSSPIGLTTCCNLQLCRERCTPRFDCTKKRGAIRVPGHRLKPFQGFKLATSKASEPADNPSGSVAPPVLFR